MIKINPGITSSLILILLIILIMTDWLSSLIQEVSEKNKIIFFLILTFIFTFFELPITNGWEVNIGGFLFPLVLYFFLLLKENNQDKIHLFSATGLLGASYFLFKELIRLDPILLFWEEKHEIAILLTIILIFVSSKLIHRVTLIFGGILVGDFLFNIHHRETFSQIVFGAEIMRDILWISVIEIVILHYVFIFIKNWIRARKFIKLLRIR